MEPWESDRFGKGIDRRLYLQAVSRGIEQLPRHDPGEDLFRPVELLATAIELTPALTLMAPVVAGEGRDFHEHREALRLTRTISAGLVRVAHRAREVHARDVGYETDAWIDQAVALAEHLAHERQRDGSRLLEHLEEASAHLADAVVALHCDRLMFADAITQAQGAWLASYARSQWALTA